VNFRTFRVAPGRCSGTTGRRSGGAAESAGYRHIAGETLSYFHQRAREEATSRAAARAAATAARSAVSSGSSSRHTVESDATEPEQVPLVGQHGDVGDALRTVRDRNGEVDQHPPRVVHRPRPTQMP
jgi:hypothetical protein